MQITWVKQTICSKFFTESVTLYTNLTTGQKVQRSSKGQILGNFAPHNNLRECAEPTENVFQITEFDGWDFYAGGYDLEDDGVIGHYCCDGDGIVSVELLTDGTINLNVQGSYMLDLDSDVEVAIKQATQYIKDEYPAIYEDFLNF
jgi:hypothetical protein